VTVTGVVNRYETRVVKPTGAAGVEMISVPMAEAKRETAESV
jgi:hypothetical protein